MLFTSEQLERIWPWHPGMAWHPGLLTGSAVRFFNEVNQRKENFMICVPEPEELNPGRTYFGFLKRISCYPYLKANHSTIQTSSL